MIPKRKYSRTSLPYTVDQMKRQEVKTLAGQIRELKAAYATMREAMPIIGRDAAPPNGLEDLAKRVKEAEVLVPDMDMEVSSEGSIYPEDMVSITHEVEKKGEPIQVANGAATLLDAVAVGDWTVMCFVQDGMTYLKGVKRNDAEGNWTLTTTKTLVERELERVVLVAWGNASSVISKSVYNIAAFYQEEDAGMVQFWNMNGTELGHMGTDIWAAEAPVNLCGAWTPVWYQKGLVNGPKQNGMITLAYMGDDGSFRLTGIIPTSNWNEEEQKSYYTAGLWAEKTILPGERTGAEVKGWSSANGAEVTGKHSDFTIMPPDTQEYLNGAWCLTGGIGTGAMWLTYPGEDGERYVLELWCLENRAESPYTLYQYEPGGCRQLAQKGYQACGAGFYGMKSGQKVRMGWGPFFLGVLSRLSGPNQKSRVGIESWCGTYNCELTPLRFGEEGKGYGGNIGLLGVCEAGDDLLAVGYAAENSYRVFLVEWLKNGEMLGGPAVEITQVGTAAKLVNHGDGILLCYQKGEDVFLQYIQTKMVTVAVRESKIALGQAVTGGRPGQIIRIKGF